MTNEGATPPGVDEMLDRWRQTATDMENRWNEYLNQVMGTEAFGQMMSRSMDSYLTVQSTFSRGMEQYLRALNLPTRADIVQLAERVALLEQKIDTLALSLGAFPGAEHLDEPAASRPKARRNGVARKATAKTVE